MRRITKKDILQLVVLVPLTIFLTLNFSPIMFVKLVGHSMEPTIQDGQRAIALRRQYTQIHRGDLVMAVVTVPEWYVSDHPKSIDSTVEIHIDKRVVGLPGEQIRLAKGQIYINGKLLDEPYAIPDGITYTNTITLGPNEYYIVGDNRPNSLDSRFFGPVTIDQIVGKLIVY